MTRSARAWSPVRVLAVARVRVGAVGACLLRRCARFDTLRVQRAVVGGECRRAHGPRRAIVLQCSIACTRSRLAHARCRLLSRCAPSVAVCLAHLPRVRACVSASRPGAHARARWGASGHAPPECAGVRACTRDTRACTCVNAGAGVVHRDALRLDVCRALVPRVSGNVASKRSRIRARHGVSPRAPRVGDAGWAAAASRGPLCASSIRRARAAAERKHPPCPLCARA